MNDAETKWLKRAQQDPDKTILVVLCIHGQSIFRGHDCADAIQYIKTYKAVDLIAAHGLTGVTFVNADTARNEQ